MLLTMSPTGPTQDAAPRRGRPPAGGREAVLAAALALLRERGASRLTTKEVAARAGVSEGSVFYHFGDRSGLLTAVIEQRLGSLRGITVDEADGDLRAALGRFSTGVESFLDGAIVAMIAAQSDAELRTGMAAFLGERDLGPHRGVQAVAQYLREQQARGAVRTDVDPEAVAFLLIGSLFMRAGQRQMITEGYGADLPGTAGVLDALVTLLAPERPGSA